MPMPVPFPLVPGHEVAGVVSKVSVIITMDMIMPVSSNVGLESTFVVYVPLLTRLFALRGRMAGLDATETGNEICQPKFELTSLDMIDETIWLIGEGREIICFKIIDDQL